MIDMLINHVAINSVCPTAAPTKNSSQNSEGISFRDLLEEQAVEIGRGFGPECKGDLLQELGTDSNNDSHGAVVQTSPRPWGNTRGWHVAPSPDANSPLHVRHFSGRHMATLPDADPLAANVSGTDTWEMPMEQHMDMSGSSGLETGSSVAGSSSAREVQSGASSSTISHVRHGT
jgi:hypothetical protein